MARIRADLLLLERGLVDSRERAQRLIMAGRVRSGTTILVKPSTPLDPAADLEVTEPERYVSRGGHKLEAGLAAFAINPTGLRCLDLGASTGGFTDCLLQHGASSVLAIDVGRAQLHSSLRNDPRVTLWEATNARSLPELPPIDLAVANLSFISLTRVLHSLAMRVAARTPALVLFKPQFEADRREVPRTGVIKDERLRAVLLDRFREWCAAARWNWLGMVESPIRGGDGNVEYLVHLEAPDSEHPC